MLKFNVRNQSISRIDNFRPAEKSIKYLLAQFDFKTEDWKETVKTAVFQNKKDGKPYDAILDEDTCVVPWEVLSESGVFEVSVYGIRDDGSRITTDIDVVNLNSTIYGGSATHEPSPNVYETLVLGIDKLENKVGELEDKIENFEPSQPGGTGGSIVVDSELSTESTNPVQNRVVAQKFGELDKDIEELSRKVEEGNVTSEKITTALGYMPANQEDVGRLSHEIGDLNKNFVIESINKLNSETITLDTVINLSNGELVNNAYRATSDFIEIKNGETYTSAYAYDYYGASLAFPIYDSQKQFVKKIKPSFVDSVNNIATFTSDTDGYTRVVISDYTSDHPMFVKGEEYPNEYIPYSNETMLNDSVYVKSKQIKNLDSEVGKIISFANKEPCLEELSLDIKDYYINKKGDMGEGGYCISKTVTSGEEYHIKSKAGSACVAYVIQKLNGEISRFHPLEDWGTEHDYDIEITIMDDEEGATLYVNTIENNYIGLKQKKTEFIVNGEKIREHSIPMSKLKLVPNKLYGKVAIFDGDSICHGTSVGSSDPTYGYGWAGRIAVSNGMNYKNFGISGGVITSASSFEGVNLHSVVDTVDVMYSEFPNADYIIFEGGTNDADRIGDARTEQPQAFGTFSLSDFSGEYDVNTFTGALETIFFKATKYWKGKHIGYIVAHRMGYYQHQIYNAENSNRRYYFERAIEVCKKWGIPYLDLWNDCYLTPSNPNMYTYGKTGEENIALGNMYTDGQHLTSKGYDYITPIIEEWMRSI